MKKEQTLIESAECDAAILLNNALLLSKAANGVDDRQKIAALDNNLKIWVQVETSIKSAKNLLPESISNNLAKLSQYVERVTLTKGLTMSKSEFDCLININMQISEGIMEAVKNSLAREEAFSLLKCAVDLSSARDKKDEKEMVCALDNNMRLWVYIKTLAKDKKSKLPSETKGNLVKLADYVSGKTLEIGKDLNNMNEKVLDTMIMTNLQISEGLLTHRSA